MFKVGDKVFVAEQNYRGEVSDIRKDGLKHEYLVRYTSALGRRPYYETWWPEACLAPSPGE